MLRKWWAFALLCAALAACSPGKAVPHEGEVVNGDMPQLQEQCRAQPQLDWCHHAK